MNKPRTIYSSADCDNGDRLADLLGIGDEWLTIDELCVKAADRIEQLQREVKSQIPEKILVPPTESETKSVMQKWWKE